MAVVADGILGRNGACDGMSPSRFRAECSNQPKSAFGVCTCTRSCADRMLTVVAQNIRRLWYKSPIYRCYAFRTKCRQWKRCRVQGLRLSVLRREIVALMASATPQQTATFSVGEFRIMISSGTLLVIHLP